MAVNHPPNGYAGSIPVSPTKTPDEWLQTAEFSAFIVLDPDGWRNDNTSWQTPLTHAEFTQRLNSSTIAPRGWKPPFNSSTVTLRGWR